MRINIFRKTGNKKYVNNCLDLKLGESIVVSKFIADQYGTQYGTIISGIGYQSDVNESEKINIYNAKPACGYRIKFDNGRLSDCIINPVWIWRINPSVR